MVTTALGWKDRFGALRMRLGVRRGDYRVAPGLYAVGHPDAACPVFVSANYKLSFDHLRRAVSGLSAWILVLDTAGINVWCAAGKGTFGTEELVRRVVAVRLAEVVKHRTLIVPQLGAPGVAAHLVRSQSGFRVVYGPVQARDLPAFLAMGKRATAEMRRKAFPLGERAALIGVELSAVLKYAAPVGLSAFLLSGLGWPGGLWSNMVGHGSLALVALVGAIFAGAVVTPLLLPWLPGRAFSIKGLTAGLVLAGLVMLWRRPSVFALAKGLELGGWLLLGLALAAFLALNFTGASTYTSLSGVRKEMRRALPLQVAGGFAGLILVVAARFA